MTNKIKLIADAACDLMQNDYKDIDIVDFLIYDATNDEEVNAKCVDELYQEMMHSEKIYKTACPTIDTYYQKFVENEKNGYATICVCITSKFSGSYNSATIAKMQALESYPNAKITVVDSKGNSALQLLLVLAIHKMINAGFSYELILSNIDKLIPTGKIMFTVETVDYLKKGGRIGKVSAFVATALNLKPIIVMRDGDIGLGGIAFGVKRTLIKVLELVKSHFEKEGENIKDYHFAVGYSSDIKAGENFLKQAIEYLKISEDDVVFNQIKECSAVHTGPNTLGLAFIKKFNMVK